MDYFGEGSPTTVISEQHAAQLIDRLLDALGDVRRVLLLPPDATRAASGAGPLTVMIYERLRAHALVEIMPAIGTHAPMSAPQLTTMFPGIPHDVFCRHDWRRDLEYLGEVPADFVRQVTDGRLACPVRCELNRRLSEGHWDHIISIGQLVPHEVIGIANHCKNVFVGVGGANTINTTHFIGAVCGMERIMGRVQSPVRSVLNYMAEHHARGLPITYVLTIRGPDEKGRIVTRGLYAGDDEQCFQRGAELSQQVNIEQLEAPLRKVVVYLDPQQYKSTWLGNKAIYRTRMALAGGGELIVLAPGVKMFGEDAEIDRLVRAYGYRGTEHTLAMVAQHAELADNLAAAAHLIHGSTEGRFHVTYCPGGLSRAEVESVGFAYADLEQMYARYQPETLPAGPSVTSAGEELFYIPDPSQSLWVLRGALENTEQPA
ncbi:MAG: DUF2088 domain-containing protein [Planctomycetes bacterium]|nr:DUF2088 domain-containing protein [Planctomycetota bacterium]